MNGISVISKTPPPVVRVISQGTKGDKGDTGPGILSNITRITASTDAPANPEPNDLWIDLS